MPATSSLIISISKAARTYRVDRRTIQRKIAKGELEKRILKGGAEGVTVASLRRVFGDAPDAGATVPHSAAGDTTAAPHGRLVRQAITEDAAAQIAALRAELAGKAEVIAAKDAHIGSLERQLDQAHTEKHDLQTALGRAQANLLAAQSPEAVRGLFAGPSADATSAPTTSEPPQVVPQRRRRRGPIDAPPSAEQPKVKRDGKPAAKRPWWRLFG